MVGSYGRLNPVVVLFAGPVLLDEFVEWMRSNRAAIGGESTAAADSTS